MSITAEQDAMRVANRYAATIQKARTLQERARACEDATQLYRADAHASQESATNHRAAARAARDVHLAHQHTAAARDAEAEAAREILAARYYEQQAQQYLAQARGITADNPAGVVATTAVPDAGHYDRAGRRTLHVVTPSHDTGKETMTASVGPAAGDDTGDEGTLPDTAGLTETSLEHWHGSEMVTGADGTVCLGLYQQPDSGAYVVVATNPADTRWEPDSDTSGVDPTLSPQEAVQLADTLDDLVALAQSAPRSPAPTRVEKLAARVQGLLGDNGGVTIVGDEGEIEVSAADIRTLLDAVAPQPAVATRRKVAAKACGQQGMDTGTVWAELDTSGPEPVVAVTSTEGNDQPEDYPQGYTTTRLSLNQAGQLAGKVRQFANATQQTGPATQPRPSAPEAAPQRAATQPRQVTSPHGRSYEYDPATGAAAVIEADGWRAVVPPTSTTGLAARLLYWRAEIQDGRGDDATVQAGQALLAGLSAAELRELADSVGTSAQGARTKVQLLEAIVNMAITSPRKYRSLQKW